MEQKYEGMKKGSPEEEPRSVAIRLGYLLLIRKKLARPPATRSAAIGRATAGPPVSGRGAALAVGMGEAVGEAIGLAVEVGVAVGVAEGLGVLVGVGLTVELSSPVA